MLKKDSHFIFFETIMKVLFLTKNYFEKHENA